MTEDTIRRFIEQLVNALAAAGILPAWAWVVLIVVAIPLFFAWRHVALTWPPHEEWDPEKPAGPVSPPIILHQTPPDSWV